jgi:tRNA A-37 threonylcarbamoyl transferase component Bud32
VALVDPGSVGRLTVSPWGSPALGVPAILPETRPLVPPRYRLLRRLAAGGTADVYLAQLTGPGGFARPVVLKALRPDASTDLADLEMFLDEARLMAQLCHHGIAQVLEVGATGDGSYFVAVEHVPGASLQTTLQTAGRRGVTLPMAFGATVVAAVARALHHAHERRRPDGRHLEIVHRDVTPANIMISHEGGVKLIDFGIARFFERRPQTQVGMVRGSPGYLAPEQLRGGGIDRRTDVFALGVVLYEATTQVRAFHGGDDHAVARRVLRGRYVPPHEVVPGYPPALAAIIARALAVAPADRHPTMAALVDELDAASAALGFARGEAALTPVHAALFGDVDLAAPPRPAHARPRALPASPRDLPAPGGSRRATVAAGLIGIALALGVARLAIGPAPPAPPAPPSTAPPSTAPPPAAPLAPAPRNPPAPVPAPALGEAPRAAPRQLAITTRPADATVVIDGVRAGRTPLVVPIADAVAGTVVVKVRRRRYVSDRRTVTLAPGVTRLELILHPRRLR